MANAKRAMTPETLEKIFLSLTVAMLVVFMGALFWASFVMGMHLPDRVGQIDPAQVRSTAPFDAPGVRQVGENQWEVVALGSAWAFQPREIRVPAGAEVTFIATATDVIHGFHVEGTKVNFMMIPGQITRVNAVFNAPGEHLVICHEYCGAGHHIMYATLTVEEEGWTPEVVESETEAEPELDPGPDPDPEPSPDPTTPVDPVDPDSTSASPEQAA